MRNARITVRLTTEELEDLKKSARQMDMPTVALARICIRNWLKDYDWKHHLLVERLDNLAAVVEQGNVLSAAAIASAAMVEANKLKPGDAESEKAYIERYREKLKAHVTSAVGTGTDICRAFGEGKFET